MIGGTALIIALVSAAVYRMIYRGFNLNKSAAMKPVASNMPVTSQSVWTAGVFVALLVAGAFTISNSINTAVSLVLRVRALHYLELLD